MRFFLFYAFYIMICFLTCYVHYWLRFGNVGFNNCYIVCCYVLDKLTLGTHYVLIMFYKCVFVPRADTFCVFIMYDQSWTLQFFFSLLFTNLQIFFLSR